MVTNSSVHFCISSGLNLFRLHKSRTCRQFRQLIDCRSKFYPEIWKLEVFQIVNTAIKTRHDANNNVFMTLVMEINAFLNECFAIKYVTQIYHILLDSFYAFNSSVYNFPTFPLRVCCKYVTRVLVPRDNKPAKTCPQRIRPSSSLYWRVAEILKKKTN